MHDDLVIPASYDVWLTNLKHHLDRKTGSKAELARYLAAVRGIKIPSAKVKVSELLSHRYMPAADLFIDITIWLQRRTGSGSTARLGITDDIMPCSSFIP